MRDRKDLLQYNAEGYYDPTAGKALLNALHNRPIGFVRWMGQPIYICPGNDPKMVSDTRLLRQFCRYAIGQGAHPTAPMLFYSGILDLSDVYQTRILLSRTRGWCKRASEIWVLGEVPMDDMRWDIKQSLKHGKVIRFFVPDAEEGFKQIKMIDNKDAVDAK